MTFEHDNAIVIKYANKKYEFIDTSFYELKTVKIIYWINSFNQIYLPALYVWINKMRLKMGQFIFPQILWKQLNVQSMN